MSFRFYPTGSSNGSTAQESIRNSTGKEAELIYRAAGDRIQVYTPSGENPDVNQDKIMMNIDGHIIRFGYSNNNGERTSATLEQLFDGAVIITLKDIA